MVPNPSDVIVLSDDEENIIDAARRASDQDKQINEALNNSVLMVSPPSNPVPPSGRPMLDTPEPELLPSTSEPTRPTGRPRMDTPERLSSNERVSPKFGSATTLKRLRNDNDDVIVVTPNESVANKSEEDIKFLKIVKKNKAVTQNTKKTNAKFISSKYNKFRTVQIKQEIRSPERSQNVESASQFAELQPYTSHPCSMVPRATATSTKDHRRSFHGEKMLPVNRSRQTPINNETTRSTNVIVNKPMVESESNSCMPSTSGSTTAGISETLSNQLFINCNPAQSLFDRLARSDLPLFTRERSESPEITVLDCKFDLLNLAQVSPDEVLEDDWPWSEPETPEKSPDLSRSQSPSSESLSRPILREAATRALLVPKEAKVKQIAEKSKSGSPVEEKTDNERTQDIQAYSKMIQHTRASGWINDDHARNKLLAKLERMDKCAANTLKMKYETAWTKKIRRPNQLDEQNKRLVMTDISNGLEPVPISVSTFTNHNVKPNFEYITENKMVAPLTAEEHPYWKICCSCTDGCGEDCECIKASISAGTVIADKYLLTTTYSDFFNTFVVACGPECSCRAKCTNSVGNVMKADNFEMFCRNEKMGYGVRANRHIEANTLLCEFIGEKINQQEHKLRRTKTNPLTPSYSYMSYLNPENEGPEDFFYKIVKTFCPRANLSSYSHGDIYVDPSRKGNLGRFFGHSEYPNITMIRLITNDARPEAARLFFYTTQPIRKHDEIFLDYGSWFDLPSGCLCDHICCGHAGKHILLQPKKKVQTILDGINEARTAEIQQFIDEEQNRMKRNSSEFHLTWRKVQLMRVRGKKFVVLRRKPAPKRKARRGRMMYGAKDEDKEN